MTLRKKIFGSLFILGCIGIVTGIVLLVVGRGGSDPSQLVMPELEPLPALEVSLTELDAYTVPELSELVPESGISGWGEMNITAPAVTMDGVTAPTITPDAMPGFSIDMDEMQQMMESLFTAQE